MSWRTRFHLRRVSGVLLPNNQRQHHTVHFQIYVLPYALCWLMGPVPAALASIFRVGSISSSYERLCVELADQVSSL